jgi:hypothetical protein
MPFSIRPFRRFPVQCAATYNVGPFQGHGTVWNVSCTGWRLSGDLPMGPPCAFLSPLLEYATLRAFAVRCEPQATTREHQWNRR